MAKHPGAHYSCSCQRPVCPERQWSRTPFTRQSSKQWPVTGRKSGAHCKAAYDQTSRRSHASRLQASVQEDQEVRDPVENMDMDRFPFDLPKPPKFKPFVGQTQTGQQLKAFRQEREVQDGTMLIQPLTEANLQHATDLLTASFAEAVGYMSLYRGFLRRQVEQYLRSHLDIAPKAITLAASLILDNDEICNDSDRDTNGSLLMDPGSTTDSGDADLAAEASSSGERCTSSIDGSTEASPTDSMDGYSAFSSQKAHSLQGSDSDSEGDGNGANGLGRQDPTGLPDSDMPDDERQELEVADRASTGQLVGTVELSFSPSTRTRSLTLSPPDDAAYLCNMAVAESFQRRGYGTLLLKAAEQVVQLAGFRRVYLHVRLKDEPAKALYRKAGYEVEKQDCFLVSLWDERRQLLSKFIPRPQSPLLEQPAQQKAEELVTEY